MKPKIHEIINAKHELSNGSCGTYFSEFITALKIQYREFEEIATEMYNDEEIDIREGINGFMLMKLKTSTLNPK